MRTYCFAALLLVAAGAVALSPVIAGTATPDPTGPGGWEYKVLGYAEVLEAGGVKPVPPRLSDPDSCKAMSEALTKLGRDGWELLSVESPRTGSMQIYYLKKRK